MKKATSQIDLYAELFYYNDNVECDFVVRDMAKTTTAYQVTISLNDLETRERELGGLISAMDAFGLKEGFIITLDEIEEIAVDGDRQIHVLPYYRWCLEKSQPKRMGFLRFYFQ